MYMYVYVYIYIYRFKKSYILWHAGLASRFGAPLAGSPGPSRGLWRRRSVKPLQFAFVDVHWSFQVNKPSVKALH